MRSNPTVSRLRTLPAFRGERDRDLRSLVSLVDTVQVPPGHVLTNQGQYGRQAFLVLEGSAEVWVGDRCVAEVGAGDFVGEMAMLDGHPRSATVRATSSMEVLAVGSMAWGAFVSHPSVSRALAVQMARRLRRAPVVHPSSRPNERANVGSARPVSRTR